METAFYVLVCSSRYELLRKVALNLSPDKPVFIEDVEPEWQSLYDALEFVPWPAVLRFLNARTLLVAWSIDFDPTALASLVEPLMAAGAEVPIGAVRLEQGEVFLVNTLPEVCLIYTPIKHDFADDADLIAWLRREAQLF